jgi:ABC-type branched-subunit amino acid transport system permease subunit
VNSLLVFTFLGLSTGGVTALLAVGLVLEHQSSRVVDFAYAAIAMMSAYWYTEFRTTGQLVLPVVGLPDRITISSGGLAAIWSAALAVVLTTLLGLVIYLAVFRPLRRAPVLASVVASIGLLLALQALAVLKFGSTPLADIPLIPSTPVSVLGASIQANDIWLAGLAIVVGFGLAAFYRFTRFGVVTRGVAENERSASMLGWSPVRVEMINWVIGSALAAMIGIVVVGTFSLTPSTLPLAIVPALAAALVARFQSFTVAALVGIAIGIVQSWTVLAASDWSWFPQKGMSDTLPFVVIVIAMVLQGEAIPSRGASLIGRLPKAPRIGSPLRSFTPTLAVVAIALVVVQGQWRLAAIQSILAVCLCLSFVVLTGFAGQASLVQSAFAGLGGFGLAKLLEHVGLPSLLAIGVVAIAAVPVGILIGIPALRIRGSNLAIVTLGAGVAISASLFNSNWLSGGISGSAHVPSASIFGLNLGIGSGHSYPKLAFGLAVLLVATVLALLVTNLRRSPTGLHLLALRSNERAAAASGINVSATKLFAFALSATLAAVGGTLIGFQQGALSPTSFTVFACLGLLAISYIGGIGSVRGAIVAAILLAPGGVGFYALDRWFSLGQFEPLIAGVGVVLATLVNPDGIAGTAGAMARVGVRVGRKPAPEVPHLLGEVRS